MSSNFFHSVHGKSAESIDISELAVVDDAANIAKVTPQKQIFFIIFSLCMAKGWFKQVKVSISAVIDHLRAVAGDNKFLLSTQKYLCLPDFHSMNDYPARKT